MNRIWACIMKHNTGCAIKSVPLHKYLYLSRKFISRLYFLEFVSLHNFWEIFSIIFEINDNLILSWGQIEILEKFKTNNDFGIWRQFAKYWYKSHKILNQSWFGYQLTFLTLIPCCSPDCLWNGVILHLNPSGCWEMMI